jgi:uncharacterized protein (TIGR03083 family)
MTDNWTTLGAERSVLADYLRTLSPGDLEQPSACEGWSVRDLAAHLVAGAKSTPWRFASGLIANGFSFDKMIAAQLAPERDGTPADFADRLAARATAHTQPGKAMIGEAIVHGEDIRHALGASGAHDVEHLIDLADHYKRAGAPIRSKARVAGLTLRANDADWAIGPGPVVEGPLQSLVLAMAGRAWALDELAGPGVEILALRVG